MSGSSALMKLLAWVREAELAAKVENSAKYFYDAAKALAQGDLKVPPDAETERLMRAVNQGHNAIVGRYGDPLRDEQHLLAMRDDWLSLPGPERGFHVDLTPGYPAALERRSSSQMWRTNPDLKPRPLSVIMKRPMRTTDELANDEGALEKLRRRGIDSVVYAPTGGEIAPTGGGELYNNVSLFNALAERLPPGQWQPSAAILRPQNVRDLREAEFKKPSATGLNYARGGLAKLKECSCHAK